MAAVQLRQHPAEAGAGVVCGAVSTVFILDSLLIDGLGFVFDKIRLAAEAEQDDDTHLREALLDGQARLEAGELSEDEYAELERDILQRLDTVRRRKQGDGGAIGSRVAGVDVEFTGDGTQR